MKQSTVRYYDNQPDSFIANTITVDHTAEYNYFLPHVKAGGKIADAGCGSCRDSRHFLQNGYDVFPFDASAELATRGEKLLGRPVRVLRFQDLEFENEFDGVWAMAALLHVPKAELPDVFRRLHRSLKQGGVLFASFKFGEEQRVDDRGLLYSDMTPESLRQLLEQIGGFEIIDISVKLQSGRNIRWVNLLVKKE